MGNQERIDGKTQLIGLIASPVRHTLSPFIHNLSFQKLNINFRYLAFDVGTDQLEDAIKGLRAMKVRGFSVSMPNKIKIIPLLDGVDPSAQLIGAVNTVVNENGKLIGYNTDGSGYMRSLKEEGVGVVGKKMTLLGAGGAGTAIAIQAALDGVREISIFNGDDDFFPVALNTAQIIRNEIKDSRCTINVCRLEDKERLKAEIAASDILVNATGVGMEPKDQSLIQDSSWLRPQLIVSDVIYNPSKTKLLEQAESVGCKAINGLGMLLWQGAKAFELWTGKELPVEYVKEKVFLQPC